MNFSLDLYRYIDSKKEKKAYELFVNDSSQTSTRPTPFDLNVSPFTRWIFRKIIVFRTQKIQVVPITWKKIHYCKNEFLIRFHRNHCDHFCTSTTSFFRFLFFNKIFQKKWNIYNINNIILASKYCEIIENFIVFTN